MCDPPRFDFLGGGDYLDNFVARFNHAPLLKHLHVMDFHHPSIKNPHLPQFILCAGGDALANKVIAHAGNSTVFITFNHCHQ